MTNYSYFDIINMSRALRGLGAIGAGSSSGLDLDFGTTVIGGTTLCVGLPLALKTTKGVAYDLPVWAYKNYGNYSEAFKAAGRNFKEVNFGSLVKSNRQFFINGIKGNGFFGGFRNAYNITKLMELEKTIPTNASTNFSKAKYRKLLAENPEKAAKYLKKFQEAKKAKVAKVKLYKEAQQKIKTIKEGIKNGSLKGKNLQKAIVELDKAVAEADKAALSIKAKPTSKLAKFKAVASKYSGAKAINSALTKGTASESGIVRTVSKGTKGYVKGGGALTSAIEFAFEVPEIVQTFRECGAGSGWKQVGKSATIAVASGVGYWAGAAAGGKVGAAIGTCIGGPIGTVVGGAIGIACGLIGSWLFKKGAKALVGKSELEKQKSNDAIQAGIAAYNDPKKLKELLAAYEQMINDRDQMVQEGAAEDEYYQDIVCQQDNTYVEQPVVGSYIDLNL